MKKKESLQSTLETLKENNVLSIFLDKYIMKVSLVLKETMDCKSYQRGYKSKQELDIAVKNLKYYTSGKAIGYIKLFELYNDRYPSGKLWQRPVLVEIITLFE